MANVRVILGPPGTGKTTTLMNEIEGLLSRGVRGPEIGFYSFTKAACEEAVHRASERFGLDPVMDLCNFRTIHSQAFRLVGKDTAEVMGDAHWKAFGEHATYSFTDARSDQNETPLSTILETDGDQVRAIFEMSRVCMCSIPEAMLRISQLSPLIGEKDVARYARALEEYKREMRLIDFTDMLVLALKTRTAPSISHAFFDEAQDNSALQNALVEHWTYRDSVRHVALVGDDDQSIYGFAGADPEHLMAAARRFPTSTLSQSYRVPRLAHGLAQRIIRSNRQRIPKEYFPKRDASGAFVEGNIEHADACNVVRKLVELDGDSFYLARNIKFAHSVWEQCLERGINFKSEIGRHAPLDRRPIRDAALAVSWLNMGPSTGSRAFHELLKLVPKEIEGGVKLRPHGVLAKAERNEDPVSLDRMRHEFGLGALADRLVSENPFNVLRALEEPVRVYLSKVLRDDQSLMKPARLTITSKHRSKGRQADNVAISSDMAGPSYRELVSGDRESEHRVAYVAVTRTKQNLILCRPAKRECFPYAAYAKDLPSAGDPR